METLTMQCGRCGQILAVSLENLGSQVHCPHCQAILQTTMEPVQESPSHEIEPTPTESLFAPTSPADDLFGSASPKPFIEISSDSGQFGFSDKAQAHGASGGEFPNFVPMTRQSSEPAWQTPAPTQDSGAESLAGENVLAVSTSRQSKRSMLAPTLLIFLIPYALLSTAVIIYLLVQQAKLVEGQKTPSDPRPKDGQRQPLQDKHKTKLSQVTQTKAACTFQATRLVGWPDKNAMTLSTAPPFNRSIPSSVWSAM